MPRPATSRILLTLIAIGVTMALVGYSAGAQAALITLIGALVAVTLASPATDIDQYSRAPRAGDGITGNRAEDAIDALPDPLLLIDGSRVTAANRAARALLGAHIVGEDVRIAIRHPAAADHLRDPNDALARDPAHLAGFGAPNQHWDLRVLPMAAGGHIIHLSDRTASHAADRIRVDFVANASHELRTPLASILGFIEVLEDLRDDPQTHQRFLGVMGKEARRMQQLIDDLMSLSRIEADKARAPEDPIDLAALVEQVRGELVTMDPARAGDVTLDLSTIAPVRGDRVQLSQLLHNIIGNALKYGQSGTAVEVTLISAGSAMLCLSVRDHGDGIAPEHLPRLTERFYRADASRSRGAGGTGLGLAIVKHIVERHRGRLDITSTQGVGTVVQVQLPIALDPDGQPLPLSS